MQLEKAKIQKQHELTIWMECYLTDIKYRLINKKSL
jgi:hypothetical protein